MHLHDWEEKTTSLVDAWLIRSLGLSGGCGAKHPPGHRIDISIAMNAFTVT